MADGGDMTKIAFLLLLFPMVAQSDPLNNVQLLLGGIFPTTKVTLNSTDDLASPGVAVGARYLADISKGDLPVSIGGEIISLNPGNHVSDTMVTNAITVSNFNSLAFLADLKFRVDDEPVFKPFVLIGLGGESTNENISATPQPGFVWTNTGTTETRTAVDSTKFGFAFTLQSGVDFVLTDKFKAGISGAWYYFASQTYDSTPVAQQTVPGFMGVTGPLSSIALLGNLTYSF